MTQANIVVPNSSGAIFRANMDAALAAIASNQAGPNPPGSPDTGWLWLDTNTPTTTIWTMNIYTGASWLPIFLLDASTGTVFPVQGIPVGASLEWNSAVLPAGYLFEDGAAVSRSAYSLLFARLGTQFGVGDGSTTFNLPDSRGSVAATKSNLGGTDSNRLQSAIVGFDPNTIGARGGNQVAILPLHGHPITDPTHVHPMLTRTDVQLTAPGAGGGAYASSTDNLGQSTQTAATGITVTAQGTANAPSLQPTIIKSKIIFTGVFA